MAIPLGHMSHEFSLALPYLRMEEQEVDHELEEDETGVALASWLASTCAPCNKI